MNNSVEQTPTNIDKEDWIICHSKSHPGLNFYVNKLTGLKVWNITESEIALAEKVGKVGPEPAGYPTMNNPTDAKIYNKQIINNQFSNQLPNLLVSTSPVGNPFGVWDNQQIQSGNFENQLFTIVPAAIAPLLNQASLQNYQQFLAQSSSLQNSPFVPQQNVQNQRTPYRRINKSFKYQQSKWKREWCPRQNIKSKLNFTNNSDLRRKIARRRSVSASDDNDFQNDQSTRNENNRNGVSSLSQGLEETSVQINLAPLKKLTATNDSHQWFVVVEKDIILQNFNFINNMVAADPDCHLVVPHHVMSELREHVSLSSDVRPRRTLRFLTQQIENGMAMLGEEVAGKGSSENTILTCVKLASRNNNIVVLIANNKETLTFKPNIKGIYVFTMHAVKNILEDKFIGPRATSPTMAIKIVVPNNFKQESRESSSNEKQNTVTMSTSEMASPMIDNSLEPPVQSVESKNNPRPFSKLVSPDIQKYPITPEGHSTNSSKNDDPQKVQGYITQRTPEYNLPSGSKMYGNNPHKQSQVARIISPIPTMKPISPMKTVASKHNEKNGKAKKHETSTRGAETYVAPADPNNANFECIGMMKKPSDSYNEPNKISPNSHDFLRKIKNFQTNNMHGTMDSSSTASTSNISLDSMAVKNIISMNRLTTAKTKGQTDNAQEFTGRLRSASASSWTSYNNDNTSASRNVNKNVIIEETSTSGVISNSESSYSDIGTKPKKQDVRKVTRRRTVVMYAVACQSMEDVLKMKSEEWVFRFVQIMEEVLRVKLQEKIPYEQKEPAPFNLQEAARCIIKKFDSHFDVVDAANKLSRLLYETSDENGKIINIEPSDYMELYSYGVFLVETFMDMCADCKEIECRMKTSEKRGTFEQDKCSCHEVLTASELLTKLLFDIQNSNAEIFTDHPDDHQPANLSMDMYDPIDDCNDFGLNNNTIEDNATDDASIQKIELRCDENHKRKYNLTLDEVPPKDMSGKRSKPSHFSCLQLTKKVDNSPCKDLTLKNAAEVSLKTFYFNSLQLTKIAHIGNDKRPKILQKVSKSPSRVITRSMTCKSAFLSSLKHYKDFKDLKNADKRNDISIKVVYSDKADAHDIRYSPKSDQEELIGLKCHSNEDNAKSPSKVVCNFKINEDFERKVKAKLNQKEYEELGYPDDNSSGEYNDSHDKMRPLDETADDMVANETYESIPDNDDYKQTTNENNLPTENEVYENNGIVQEDVNAKFEHLTIKLTRGLKYVFTQVISLCNSYCMEFTSNLSDKCKQQELHREVEVGYLLLLNIYNSLTSINKCEYTDKSSYIQMLLKSENIEEYFLDDRLCMKYRKTINICSKMAGEIVKVVQRILEGTKPMVDSTTT